MKTFKIIITLLACICTINGRIIDTCPGDRLCEPIEGFETVCGSYGVEKSEIRGCVIRSQCGMMFGDSGYFITCPEESMQKLILSSSAAFLTIINLL